jgi:hypothetical protein
MQGINESRHHRIESRRGHVNVKAIKAEEEEPDGDGIVEEVLFFLLET